MKKFNLIILTFALLAFVLSGCKNQTAQIEKVIVQSLDGSYSAVFTIEEDLKVFKGIISQAVKNTGIVDMREADFHMEVIYENQHNQNYKLWLGNIDQRSTLMNTDDTHTVYTIPAKLTKELIRLFQYFA